MRADFDIAIVGSGFAGSLMAMVARRVGRSVILLERGRHPRFAIGESTSPLARLVLDASGARGFLGRLLGIADRGFDGYPVTQSLFSHFTDVLRCDRMEAYVTDERPPYPIDDAALHHVFDGGWMWVLRFGNGVT